ncbi:MAG: hypothetical protein M0D53_01290 [Flavobacterium sp. JAD_PAG50586_2]|nr:MAG: hypothetical protein M0D53_01290 [Flavobacterium sp. JAD_PAG50586_2]
MGWTQTDTRLDFEGKTINTVVSHRRTANPGANDIVTAADNFTYTDQSRLVSHTKSVNGGQSQLIAENSYDDLGQLISKKVGNTASSPLQKVDYNYNIRGWLKNINNDSSDNIILNTSENDLFSFKINYNTLQDNTNFSGTKMFNGNISQTYWRSVTDNNLRKYEYHYDGLSRLTDAIYSKPESIQPDVSTYNEGLKYDKNGNITYLRRYGGVDGVMPEQKIDELDYFYDNNGLSNRLLKVTDATNSTSGFADGANSGNDYYYDNYGNMIADYNKGIYGIRYNHLNLPMEITFANNDIISYVYDGEGKKLEKSVTQEPRLLQQNI